MQIFLGKTSNRGSGIMFVEGLTSRRQFREVREPRVYLEPYIGDRWISRYVPMPSLSNPGHLRDLKPSSFGFGALRKEWLIVLRMSDLSKASTPMTSSFLGFRNSGLNKSGNGTVSYDPYEQSLRCVRSGSGVESILTMRSMSVPLQSSEGNFRIDRTRRLPKNPTPGGFERASRSGCGSRPHSTSHPPFRRARTMPPI